MKNLFFHRVRAGATVLPMHIKDNIQQAIPTVVKALATLTLARKLSGIRASRMTPVKCENLTEMNI